MSRELLKYALPQLVEACPICNGKGTSEINVCHLCCGSGFLFSDSFLPLPIPLAMQLSKEQKRIIKKKVTYVPHGEINYEPKNKFI